MINLEAEAKKQKMKLSNIFWQHMKYSITLITLNLLSATLPSSKPSVFQKIVLYATLISFAFNVVVFVYLVCIKKSFPRIEFFLIYTVNLFLFLAILISALKQFVSINHKEPLQFLFIRGLIFLQLQRELEILVIMIFPFEIANRQVNICTSNVCVFLLLTLDEDQKNCSSDSKMTILGVMLVNIITLVFFTIFNLLFYKYPQMRRQIRNFINLSSILLFFIYAASYIAVIFRTPQQCDDANYIFQAYVYIVPVNLISICFIVYQEYLLIHSDAEREQLINENAHLRSKCCQIMYVLDANQHFMMATPQKQITQQYSKKQSSLRSQQSQSINLQSSHFQQQQSIAILTSSPSFPSRMDDSQNISKSRNPKMLEKFGTSQFGDSIHPKGMLHSWANVQNTNPFFGHTESFVNQISNGDVKSQNNKFRNSVMDESIIKKEGDESFQVPNPMDSGSQMTVK